MKLSVRGAKDKQLTKLFKIAANHIADNLLSQKLKKNINVQIHIKDNLGAGGYCDFEEQWPYPPRDFTIELDRTKKRIHMFLALAHEFVHLKQYAKGEVKDKLYRRKYVKVWMGQVYDDDVSYWDQPWEIEAYGLENSLIAKFLKEHDLFDELKQKPEDWFVQKEDMEADDKDLVMKE
jgi:hypothetical protein